MALFSTFASLPMSAATEDARILRPAPKSTCPIAPGVPHHTLMGALGTQCGRRPSPWCCSRAQTLGPCRAPGQLSETLCTRATPWPLPRASLRGENWTVQLLLFLSFFSEE